MRRKYSIPIALYFSVLVAVSIQAQPDSYSLAALQEDFKQFREILENEHCCLYEYTPKSVMDSMFDAHYCKLADGMKPEEFFMLLAPVTARIGCMHTAAWMPGSFFTSKPAMMFPLTVKLIEGQVLETGSYHAFNEIPRGSRILAINGRPLDEIIGMMRKTTSADALNPNFIDAQIMKRFSMFYASIYGLPAQYEIRYLPPKNSAQPEIETRTLTPADIESVRKVVFAHFNHPPLGFEIIEDKETAVLTIPTFIYYDSVAYFGRFMDSCFHLISARHIGHLILDLRGNDGGDPFCSSILLSYLQPHPVPYFADSYGKYGPLSEPLPLPENHFTGRLYTLVDGSCGSTNGHFCALLKYHNIGKFVGTPTGATYKCNAGRNTEFRLQHTQMILTIGRSTYSAAVKGMVKTAIPPDIPVRETPEDFLQDRDVYLESAFHQIEMDNNDP